MKKVRAFAPITAANFIIGFDTLGAALKSLDQPWLGDIVTIEESQKDFFEITGAFSYKLPSDPYKNLAWMCQTRFHEVLLEKKMTKRPMILSLEKRLPVSSGLGSSAASTIATLLALNTFYGQPMTLRELLAIAGEMEGRVSGAIHYDNVAPSLLGGLQLMRTDACISETLPFFEDWLFVIYYPGIEVSTHHARQILPKALPLKDCTRYWQKLACFIQALHRGDQAWAASLLQDDLIEPHRSAFVPEFQKMRRTALEAGAFSFGLSGSGPTCLAITDTMDKAFAIQKSILNTAPYHADSFVCICEIDKQGAHIFE